MLSFSWEELWNFHDSLQEQTLRDFLQEEVIGQGWLYRQTAKEQGIILRFAPREFIERIAPNLKPEVQISMGINPYIRSK